MATDYYHSIHKIEEIEFLNSTTFIIKMERKGIDFTPGQHLVVGKKGESEFRQYSLYNGEDSNYFEILVKEVDDGALTPKLKKLQVGEELEINGPMGYFTISENRRKNHPIVMIATGTGIAPFKSMIASHKDMNYKLIHGVRTIDEAYEKVFYPKKNYTLCTTRDKNGDFHGRVTDFIKDQKYSKDTLFYLCGNSEMIFDAMEILKDKGLNANNMFAEVYF
ncbi:MAG: oxidoreductase [Salinivirgaceae bacterium]|nr:oxidoreductase [Salinivirgaceae bacterium]